MVFVEAMAISDGAEILFILQMVALSRRHQSKHCKSLHDNCFCSYFSLLVLIDNILLFPLKDTAGNILHYVDCAHHLCSCSFVCLGFIKIARRFSTPLEAVGS